MNTPERLIARQDSRAHTVARSVTTALCKQAVNRVCAVVKDAGGTFSGLTACTAQAKVRSVFNEDTLRHVIQHHPALSARDWRGRADDALQRATHRAVRAIGPLLGDKAYLSAARLLVELTGSHPQALSPEVAEHVKRRMGGE